MTEALPRALAFAVALALLLTTVSGVRQLVGPADAGASVARVALQLVVLGLAWLLVDTPVECPVLWVWRPGHGLTAADVLSAPPLLLAGLLALRHLTG